MGNRNPILKINDSFGPYKIIRFIGRGSLGEVYEGVHTILGKIYALKLIYRGIINDENARRRFANKSRDVFHLSHPGIVGVDHFDQVDGQFYLRMDLIPGIKFDKDKYMIHSLEEYFKMCYGSMPEDIIISILSDIMKAISYAHKHKVVHQNIKPSNILLYNEKNTVRAKIGDFGLFNAVGNEFIYSRIRISVSKSRLIVRDLKAKLKDLSVQKNEVEYFSKDAEEKAFINTYDYMAPELKEGFPVIPQSDLYSIGIIAFKMLTGKKFLGGRMNRNFANYRKQWDKFVQKATDPDINTRFKNAEEMETALKEIKLLKRGYLVYYFYKTIAWFSSL